MSLKIDTIAYTNRLRQLPPVHKLLFASVLLAIAYLSQVHIQLSIAVWMSIWIVVYAGISAKLYFQLLSIAIGFWLTSLPALAIGAIDLAHLATVRADIWQGWTVGNYYLYLSFQGIQQAAIVGSRALATTTCVYFAILTIPFVDILDILRRLGCPVLLIDLLMLMYRFIFLLLETASQLWTAQQSRGGYRTRQLWLKSLGLLVGQLLRRTLENYRQMSLTLAARGFTGDFRVYHSRQYLPSKRYSFEAIFGCVLLGTISGWQYAVGI
jgi:cobalt/nickel transport system permease protein